MYAPFTINILPQMRHLPTDVCSCMTDVSSENLFPLFCLFQFIFLGIGYLHSFPVNLIYTTFGLININKKYSFAGTVTKVMWVLSHAIAQIVSR
jgi:hypothetical protein